MASRPRSANRQYLQLHALRTYQSYEGASLLKIIENSKQLQKYIIANLLLPGVCGIFNNVDLFYTAMPIRQNLLMTLACNFPSPAIGKARKQASARHL
jgi:hypothetical protein